MKIDAKSWNEKLPDDIKREATKISALSSGKIHKYEDLKVNKYYLLIKIEWYNKPSSQFLLLIKDFENK